MNRIVVPDPAQTIEATVEVDGAAVRYFTAGPADTSRAPIVMIHGTGGSTQAHFGFLFPMIAVRRRVVSLDLAPPAGKGELTLDALERQVLAVLATELPGRKVTLIGYSLGAVLAAFVAARNPEAVENLVLLAGWMKTDTQQLLRNGVWRALRDAGLPEIREYTTFCAFGAPFLASKTPADLAPGMAMMQFNDFIDAQMDLNRRIDLTDLAPRIRARTLVIGCTYDQMVPRHHSKALFGAIEDARYTEVASGHAVVFERPAEVLRLMEEFSAAPGRWPAGAIIPAAKP